MAVRDERQHETMAATDKFPMGIRVLIVDDDLVCLKILEALLCHCKYHVTIARDGETALRMLRAGKQQYNLVISDVHMPDMNGFRLLELIGLEMDIPVIMLSANEEEKSIVKGISSGACDYLVKPVQIKELKNIWKHVIRRKTPDPRVQPTEIAEGELGTTKSTRKKCLRRKMDGEYDADENKENRYLSTKKKPRMTWTSELHGRFLQAVNQIGIDRAVPKKILKIMGVSYVTREAIASHLQKYRIYMKKVMGYTGERSYPFVDSPAERLNLCCGMNGLGSYNHHHEYGSSSNSSKIFPRMNSPSQVGAHGVQLATKSFHLRHPQNSMGMRPIVPDGSMLKDARKLLPLSLCADSFGNIPDDTMLDHGKHEDGDVELPTYYPGNSYAHILRTKLLEASKGIPGDSYDDMQSDAAMLMPVKKPLVQSTAVPVPVPVNQIPRRSPQFGSQHSVQMNSTLAGNDSHFQNIVGNYSTSCQTVLPTELPDFGHNGGASTSLGTSRGEIHKINQLARVENSSGPILVLEDQMAAPVENTAPTSTSGSGEPALPFFIEGNTSSMDMLDGNFAVGGASSISSPLPGLEIDGFLAPTLMLNYKGAVGSQAPDGQLNYNNDFLPGTNEPDTSATWDEILADFQNKNCAQDNSFMDGDWN